MPGLLLPLARMCVGTLEFTRRLHQAGRLAQGIGRCGAGFFPGLLAERETDLNRLLDLHRFGGELAW